MQGEGEGADAGAMLKKVGEEVGTEGPVDGEEKRVREGSSAMIAAVRCEATNFCSTSEQERALDGVGVW